MSVLHRDHQVGRLNLNLSDSARHMVGVSIAVLPEHGGRATVHWIVELFRDRAGAGELDASDARIGSRTFGDPLRHRRAADVSQADKDDA